MLTISTFNVQNDIKNYTKDKKDLIINYLKDNKIDILNLQEVYSSLDKDLNKSLRKMKYSSYGKYRFYLKRLLNPFNEKTPIVTNKKILKYKTYHLPSLPSLTKRILTRVVIDDDGEIISIYNTHLDHKREKVKERQLKKIIRLIKKDNNKIILTGDFNLKNNNPLFQEFIKIMDETNIKHIDIGNKTLKWSKYKRAIDHIFVSKEFDIVSKKLITDIPTSDHYPILIKIKLKKSI